VTSFSSYLNWLPPPLSALLHDTIGVSATRDNAHSGHMSFGDTPEIATKLADLVVAGVQRDPTAIVDHWKDQYLLSLTANGRSLLFSQILH